MEFIDGGGVEFVVSCDEVRDGVWGRHIVRFAWSSLSLLRICVRCAWMPCRVASNLVLVCNYIFLESREQKSCIRLDRRD